MRLSSRWLRLRLMWLFAPVALLVARPSVPLLVAGAVVAAVGVAIRAWAAGTIHKNRTLTTTGPYAYTRNPLYLGTFFIGLGLAVTCGRIAVVAGYLVLFAAVYGWTMRKEERRLERQFGEAFRAYALEVPAFFPRLSPYRAPEAGGPDFRLGRYLAHREYQAPLGALLGFVALAAKLFLT